MLNAFKNLIAGTITRGILWAAGGIATKYGIDTVSNETAEGLAAFAVALALAIIALYWSKAKDKKISNSTP